MKYTATYRTLTLAQKAYRVLSAAGYDVSLVRVDASRSRYGCAWGIEFSKYELSSVTQVLAEGRANPTNIIEASRGN